MPRRLERKCPGLPSNTSVVQSDAVRGDQVLFGGGLNYTDSSLWFSRATQGLESPLLMELQRKKNNFFFANVMVLGYNGSGRKAETKE